MSFLLALFSFFSIMTTTVEWVDYNLTIELNENIEKYREIPQALLYINGVLIIDPIVHYQRNGVERTFFSVVNTRQVKTFIIKYRVYFPEYNIEHTQEIVFDIVDNIAPIIHSVPVLKITAQDKLPDLVVGFIYSDNYNENEQLIIIIDHTQVVLKQVGMYPIIYQVTDLSGNTTKRIVYLEVYDHLAPKIKLKSPIVLAYGETFVWQDFLTITDNIDLLMTVIIDDSKVDYGALGTYQVLVSAIDSSGLKTTVRLELLVIDEIDPVIQLVSYTPMIEVFSVLTREQMLSYIVNVSDNYSDLSRLDVEISNDIRFDALGEYYIYYFVSDSSGNQNQTKIKVRIVDQEKPTIIIDDSLVFDVFGPRPFLIDYLDYFDNYDDKDVLKIRIDEKIQMDIVGKYQIVIEVEDSSKNKTILRLYVEVVDKKSPVVTQLNELIIVDFRQKDLSTYFKVEDNYDKDEDISLIIDDKNVDYGVTGSYIVILNVCDKSGNWTINEIKLFIIDIIEPVIVLKQSSISVEVFSEPLDLMQFIDSVFDNYDRVNFNDIVFRGEVDYEKIGVYIIEVILKDSALNQGITIIEVTVDDLTKPIVTAFPITLFVNDKFDPLIGIEVIDNLNQYKIDFFPKVLDTSTPGVKIVTYIVTDSRGNYSQFDREIIVRTRKEKNDPHEYLPVLIITAIGAGAIFYFYKRMS